MINQKGRKMGLRGRESIKNEKQLTISNGYRKTEDRRVRK